MTGIVSYGAYIPLWRLSRDAIAKSWGRASLGGERSIANNDEDTVTMAVEATLDCLTSLNRQDIDGLYFASTSSPFQEKQCAALVAAAADFNTDIRTSDFSNSLRAGTNALRSALDAVSSGLARTIIAVASDIRIGYPRSDYEQNFGDAAAAIAVGSDKPIATIDAWHSISNEMYDVWRLDKDQYVQSWEDRFITEHGYMENTIATIKALMKKQNLAVTNITKAVIYAPSARTHQQIIKTLGFDPKIQVQDPLYSMIGISGSAHALLMLTAALDDANAGDTILVASYGDGCDAFILKVTPEITRVKNADRGVKRFLNSKQLLPSYEKYLSYRGLLEPQPGEPFKLVPSASSSWRERNSYIRFHGSKCKQCGTIIYPVQHICYTCLSKDNYEEIRLADHKGKIFTFVLDNLAGRSDDPVVPQIVIESELNNARIYSNMTDCDPTKIVVDMPVQMTFRRVYEGAGMYNYYWKCRPIR